MQSIASKIPTRILRRIFEYVFWVGVSGTKETEQIILPIGQLDILPSLAVNHAWRRRAAGLFYRTAVVAIGTNDVVSTVVGPRRVRTNIQLILESGYAPKSTRLVLLTIGNMSPVDIADCMLASGFSSYIWPVIDTLHFYNPLHKKSPNDTDVMDAQDEAIYQINKYLAVCMPKLSHIYALSGSCDSFGLFILDDLIDARIQNLLSLAVVSQCPLKLGFHSDALNLTQLTMHTAFQSATPSASITSVKRTSEGDFLTDDSRSIENTSKVVSSTVITGMPRVFAETLVSLDIGPIFPEGIWSTFFGIEVNTGNPNSQTIPDFVCLRHLRLVFANPLSTHGENSRRKSRQANRQHASPGPDNVVVDGRYPLFPKLESLKIEGYPYNIVLFLENFPRSRLLNLELQQCPHDFFNFSLSAFTSLRSTSIQIPDTSHSRQKEYVETWISCLFNEPALKLRSLCLSMTSIEDQIDFPAQHYRIDGLVNLELYIGIRSVEIEKILFELKFLRSLNVIVTDVLSKTHEYLSRNIRRKKYPKHKRSHMELSSSLVELSIRLVDLSPTRIRRVLAKTAWIAVRIPSILRICIQQQYLHTLKGCIEKILNNKSAPVDKSHIATLQLHPLNE
ncbi:hypothetical protein COEREDRAFT_14993 [Coemansia reversa NRRL 1564]|uniref:F-box domain-containing protein n=1 Tax=Coemansia reversa (strain ATCC 12441 / NRRL 1564) TaxID=763665 RepID=A0A2G5BDS3_COERN|nr:hypothetical protein COEREDRAFT_14993 [Coemansia reversa NRRL 1564]|eukprot:PIA17155.1 hypothetical protein COEREDRAFT_14993 [Coemansia reversa NRRL 1564]